MGVVGLVVGAFTVLVTMGRVPDHIRKKPLNTKTLRDHNTHMKRKTTRRGQSGMNDHSFWVSVFCFSAYYTYSANKGNTWKSAFVLIILQK